MKIYFDIETSGLYIGEQSEKNARILSITAIKTDGDTIIDKFATFVACGEYLPKCPFIRSSVFIRGFHHVYELSV